ncbi:MAG: hypothetical protein R6U00_01860 [Prochlorococcaceae cyanobacterium]
MAVAHRQQPNTSGNPRRAGGVLRYGPANRGKAVLERFTVLFPLWTVAGVLLALPFPWLFTWMQGPLIVLALALVMLGMGLELQAADFRRVLGHPRPAALGVIAQFAVMPAVAAAVASTLQLEPPLAVGLILLGWLIPAAAGQPAAVRRTLSIEVGIQNSGLAVVLARSAFAASPLTALPGAISAVVHAVLGSLLASCWRLGRSGFSAGSGLSAADRPPAAGRPRSPGS